jgi:hypothetical protein
MARIRLRCIWAPSPYDECFAVAWQLGSLLRLMPESLGCPCNRIDAPVSCRIDDELGLRSSIFLGWD